MYPNNKKAIVMIAFFMGKRRNKKEHNQYALLTSHSIAII